MATNYDVTPAGKTSPVVRLYGDSMEPIERAQKHVAERHAVIAGATPASDSNGLQPGEEGFRGFWFGSDAATLATRLRDKIIDDPDVERVDVQAVDDSGTNVSSPYNGTYRIADAATVGQPAPGTDTLWRYDLRLIED